MQALQATIRALRGPILVTGASGFIGANLFKLIAEVRSDVYAVVMREKAVLFLMVRNRAKSFWLWEHAADNTSRSAAAGLALSA